MTPPVIARWTSIIENGRTDEPDALVAYDAKTLKYLKAAAKVFGANDFHYVELLAQ
ncbi:MAG TPA: hypothetical protein VMB04_14580 [Mycobacterium sp.]|nr:hypothetical protein [Mycobacterium sp.]